MGRINGSHSEGVQAIRAELAAEKNIDLPDDNQDKGSDNGD